MAELKTKTEPTSKKIMKKRMLLLSAVLLVTLVSVSQDQETKKGKLGGDLGTMPVIKQVWDSFDLLHACLGKPGEKGKLGIDLSTTFVSRHMWHGFDLLDDHGAFIPSGTVYFGDTGFSGKIIGVQPLSSGFEKSVELDYAAFYEGSFLKGTPYLTNFTANYFYYGKPNRSNQRADSQELGISFSRPELIQVGWADEFSDLKDRTRELEEENRMLKEKIATMESTEGAEQFQQQTKATKARKIDKKDRKGWMTAEYQFDTRGFNTINFTGGADLPLGWSIWGFTDIETADSHEGSRADAQEFFTEIDLKKELYKGFGVVLEYNDGEARHNSIGRLGVNYIARWDWLKKKDLNLGFKVFPIETDGHGWQGSFCWEKKFPKIFDGRFSMGGFFDINFDSGPSDNETNIVTETQARYKLTENLEALVEFRFNGYKVASQEHGLGIGLKYKF